MPAVETLVISALAGADAAEAHDAVEARKAAGVTLWLDDPYETPKSPPDPEEVRRWYKTYLFTTRGR